VSRFGGAVAAASPRFELRPIAAVVVPPVGGGDTTAPVFAGGPSVSGITSSSAVIGWATNEAATSRVEYGSTPSLGSFTQVSTALVTSHSVTLSGLTPATTYHYRARSSDAAGNEGVSQILTFATPAIGGGGGGGGGGTFIQAFTNNGPHLGNTGPRVSMQNVAGGNLQPGLYQGLRFTTGVAFASSTGTYTFVDCEFAGGGGLVYGWVDRVVNLYHCRIPTSGLSYAENGGYRNWKLIGCFCGDDVGVPIGSGSKQAWRPKGRVEGGWDGGFTSPTNMLCEDTYFRIVGQSSNPDGHEEAVQSLGGNGDIFRRCTFDTYAPYRTINGLPQQTATINYEAANCLWEDCTFRQRNCAYYMIYSDGVNCIFRRCRISMGLAGYYYRGGQTWPYATFQQCTDYDTGAAINP
jgi:hypothetical protein